MIRTWFSFSTSMVDIPFFLFSAVKSKYVATLIVDDRFEDVKIGPAGQSAADTDLPLFLGSLPPSEPDMKIVGRKQYVGCMRNLKLNEQLENFANGRVAGSVLLIPVRLPKFKLFRSACEMIYHFNIHNLSHFLNVLVTETIILLPHKR